MNSSPEQCLFRFVWPRRVFSAIPTTVVERTSSRVVLWIARGDAGALASGDAATDRRACRAALVPRGGALVRRPADDRRGRCVPLRVRDVGEGRRARRLVREPRGAVAREPRSASTRPTTCSTSGSTPIGAGAGRTRTSSRRPSTIGLFTPAKADAIRAEGERAIERIEAWSTPFDEGWETWRPDPDWPLPELPDGWDAL